MVRKIKRGLLALETSKSLLEMDINQYKLKRRSIAPPEEHS